MDVRKLGGSIQSLKTGMSREEFEKLFGKPTGYSPLGVSLYSIDDLRKIVNVSDERQILMSVYLWIDFEGDEGRRKAFFNAGENFDELKKGLSTDKLLSFAIDTIDE